MCKNHSDSLNILTSGINSFSHNNNIKLNSNIIYVLLYIEFVIYQLINNAVFKDTFTFEIK